MNLTEAAVSATIAVSVAGLSYAAFHSGGVTRTAEKVAEQASCRAVDTAVAAYLADHDRAPARIADLRPYVKGDISAYRLVGGLPEGPGCA